MTTYNVWTYNTSPEWLAKNSGVPDMLLIGGVDRYNANFLALRLKELTPGGDFFVRDGKDNFVPLVPRETAYLELVENPRRVAAGLPPREPQPWEEERRVW